MVHLDMIGGKGGKGGRGGGEEGSIRQLGVVVMEGGGRMGGEERWEK